MGLSVGFRSCLTLQGWHRLPLLLFRINNIHHICISSWALTHSLSGLDLYAARDEGLKIGVLSHQRSEGVQHMLSEKEREREGVGGRD